MALDKQHFTSILTKTFNENGLSKLLSRDVSEKLFTLTEFMLSENEKYNLTAITDPEKIILNHYADCATLAAKLKKGAKIADIGCGAGFPTLPVAILRPDLKITAIDSTAKRINYVAETAAMMGLDNITAIAMRAEDGGTNPEHREKYDYATARAVAEMRVLTELCLPYVKVGGQMVAMKGKNAQFELQGAKKAIATLGGRDAKCEDITLKSDEETLTHPLIVISKTAPTPKSYPRPFAKISKQPL